MPVDVYSGIKPSPELVKKMTEQRTPSSTAVTPDPRPNPRFSQQGANPPPIPPRQNTSEEPPPPSYEDAMAEDLGPIDGPRRDYEPPETGSANWGDKHDELLFPASDRAAQSPS
jgi:hypothetical protein